MLDMADHPRIAIDEHTCFGKPRIKETRLAITFLLRDLAESGSVADTARQRQVSEDDVIAALRFASELARIKDPVEIIAQQDMELDAFYSGPEWQEFQTVAQAALGPASPRQSSG